MFFGFNVGRSMFDVGRSSLETPMAELSLKRVCDLLGTNNIAGSEKELEILCIRIGELLEANGKDWILHNRHKLLSEWNYIVRKQIMK
jgi:hypothetical protein